jgi:hypothetical protein
MTSHGKRPASKFGRSTLRPYRAGRGARCRTLPVCSLAGIWAQHAAPLPHVGPARFPGVVGMGRFTPPPLCCTLLLTLDARRAMGGLS